MTQLASFDAAELLSRMRPRRAGGVRQADTLPGREADVDFGEIGVRPRGQLVTCHPVLVANVTLR